MIKSVLCLAFSGVSLLCLADGALSRYVIKGYAQGTDYTITYFAVDSLVNKPAIDSILAVIDHSMSLYKPNSLINSFNDESSRSIVVDAHFRNVIEKSLEIAEESKGIFDITVAPLVQLWGFGVRPVDRLPDSSEVLAALSCVGMDKISLSGNILEKETACVKLDVNGIAQGYSVDVLADFMEQKGIRFYIVELGGELRVKGPKPDGTAMRIGIERPVADGTKNTFIHDVVEIKEGAITTAGNYRKFLVDGDREISHHIDPTTGYPFNTGIISATVYAKDAMTADAYDNVVMAMKAEEAVAFANGHPNVEVFIIYKDGDGVVRDMMSVGFKNMMVSN